MPTRLVLASLLLASSMLPAAAQNATSAPAPAVAPSDVPGPAECIVHDTTGMITLVICPTGLGIDALRVAGEAACDSRDPCLAWIWDDPAAVPDEAPATSEELGGETLAAARAVWVQYDRQLISMETPYVGIGAEEVDNDSEIDAPPLLPLLD